MKSVHPGIVGGTDDPGRPDDVPYALIRLAPVRKEVFLYVGEVWRSTRGPNSMDGAEVCPVILRTGLE
jgi:hypothetical protein